MLTGPHVILALKFAVGAVTLLLIAGLLALWFGKPRWHGRINIVFFTLTLTALILFEGVIRVIEPDVFSYFDEAMQQRLRVHLCFSVPSALLMPFMLFTGLRGHRRIHLGLAAIFGVLWAGTFITGIFYL